MCALERVIILHTVRDFLANDGGRERRFLHSEDTFQRTIYSIPPYIYIYILFTVSMIPRFPLR